MIRRLALAFWSALPPVSERQRLQARLEYDVPNVPASWGLAALQLGMVPIWAETGTEPSADGDAV
jgi:hypothetical protein